MKNPKHRCFKVIGIILLAIIAIFLPFIANHFWGSQSYSQDGIIGYYGALLGATATIIAIIITVKQYRESQVKSVKPYLQSQIDILASKKDLENYCNNAIYLYYPFNGMETVGSSPFFNSSYIFSKEKDKTEFINTQKYLVISYILTNAGAGSAVQTEMQINGLSHCYPEFCIEPGRQKQFVMIIGYEKADSDIRIQLIFHDIYDNQLYEQHENFHIKKQDDNSMSITIKPEDGLSKPTVVKRKGFTNDKT